VGMAIDIVLYDLIRRYKLKSQIRNSRMKGTKLDSDKMVLFGKKIGKVKHVIELIKEVWGTIP